MDSTATVNDGLLAEYFDDLLSTGATDRQPPPAPAPATEAAEECMIFVWHGLRLAIHRNDLRGVCAFPASLQPAAHPRTLGSLDYQASLSRVIDLRQLLLPQAGAAVAPALTYDYLLVLRDGQWALPAQAVSGLCQFNAAEVRRRTTATRRPWLAGTSTLQQCAILDVDAVLAWAEETPRDQS